MKIIVALIALSALTACTNQAYQQHLEMVRAACQQGDPASCIDYQNALTQQREAINEALSSVPQSHICTPGIGGSVVCN